jgi:hypothetical protein
VQEIQTNKANFQAETTGKWMEKPSPITPNGTKSGYWKISR